MIKNYQLDCKQGGFIEYESGEVLQVAPCAERELLEVWGNGAMIELLYHPQPLPGEDESDRIQLLVTEAGGVRRGWLLNVEDANSLIHALTIGIRLAIDDRIPVAPKI